MTGGGGKGVSLTKDEGTTKCSLRLVRNRRLNRKAKLLLVSEPGRSGRHGSRSTTSRPSRRINLSRSQTAVADGRDEGRGSLNPLLSLKLNRNHSSDVDLKVYGPAPRRNPDRRQHRSSRNEKGIRGAIRDTTEAANGLSAHRNLKQQDDVE